MQTLRGNPCGICGAARCCDEKGDRYAFALMEWKLLNLGDRLRVLKATLAVSAQQRTCRSSSVIVQEQETLQCQPLNFRG